MKNYIPFFELKKLQVTYIPREENWKYSKLYLDLDKWYLSFLNSKNLIAAWIAWFIFLKQFLFFIIAVFVLFFLLSLSKKWAKRLHLLIPIIVYSKMSEKEVSDFLKRNPQFGKKDTQVQYSNSKIIEQNVDDISDDIMSKISEKPILSKNENNAASTVLKTSTKKEKESLWNKSIFDNYESVMDKFNKK